MRIRYTTGKGGKPVKKASVYTAKEHGIDPRWVDADARRVVQRLRENGHEAYIVGGAVRDLILGKDPKDFDIATDATPNRIKRLFRNARIIGRRFRLVHIFFGTKIFEVSTFRSLAEGSVGNSFGTIDEDVQRRDFSCNALYYEPGENIVVDFIGGVDDIRKGRLRPVIPCDRIFIEDPVRMLRAAKYSTGTGLSLPFLLKRQIRRESALLEPVSPSRLTEELMKVISSGKAAALVKAFRDLKLFRWIQPGADALIESSRSFEKAYNKSMSDLDSLRAAMESEELDMVPLLACMLRDFIGTRVDWSTETGESFRELMREARSFILPMNPPRIAFEKAVRKVFIDNGVPSKRLKRQERVPVGDGGETGSAPIARKRRRRRRRPADSAASTPAGTP